MRDDDAGPNVVPEDPPASELGGENSNPPGSESPGHLPPGGLPGDERPAPTPVPPVAVLPELGEIVLYTLTEVDAEVINRRRCAFDTLAAWPGTQKHWGHFANAGDVCPALVVAVEVATVNLQVFLNGNDVLWVCTGSGIRKTSLATPAHLGPGGSEPNPPGVPAPPTGVPDTSGPEI